MVKTAAVAVLLVACGGRAPTVDGGPSCAPLRYSPCIIDEPPLPPQFWPWHCTDGPERGRAHCAVCSPVQPTYCDAGGVVCVESCASCQVPGWPPCHPEDGAGDGVIGGSDADLGGWLTPPSPQGAR